MIFFCMDKVKGIVSRDSVSTAELSGPWHSALKLSHLTLEVRSMLIFALAIRGVNIAISFDSVTKERGH
jgi:hypothetical protein